MLDRIGALSGEGQIAVFGFMVLAAVGLVLFLGGVASLRRFLYVLTTPVSDANAVDAGIVDVEGEVVAGDDRLDAPISDVSCVAYAFEVKRYENDTRGASWQVRQSGQHCVPFVLDDDTGRVGVDPTADALAYTSRHSVSLPAHETVDDFVRDDIKSPNEFEGGLGALDGKFTENAGDVRYVERRLDVGEYAYVHGLADPDRSVAGTRPTVGEPDEYGLLTRLRTGPLVVADANEGTAGDAFLLRGLAGVVVGGFLFAFVAVVLHLTLPPA